MGFLEKIKNGLSRTKQNMAISMNNMFASFTGENEEFFDDLEETLILADAGVDTATDAVERLREVVKQRGLRGGEEVRAALSEILCEQLTAKDNGLTLTTKPSVILVVGVNGVGKTTTIGKLSARFAAEGKSVLLAAGDTFRAAAAEQLTIWAERSKADIVRHEEGSDPAAVVFDSIAAAKARGKDVIIIDTAGSVSVKELQYFTGVSSSVINTLEKKGIITSFEKQEFRMPYVNGTKINREEIILTTEQQSAFDGLAALTQSQNAETALLYGVTGSGKTKVFLKLVDDVSARGEGVIIMVPEIALTPQMIKIFSERYGSKIAVFHSAMSLGQRMDEYNRIKHGKALIAIGTRSAIFAPFSKLGLIIIDEEQEHTYKSEKSPRFHARDLARFRSAYHKCLLCLASATPSVESYSNAVTGKYKLFTLKQRYGNAMLPEVWLVDMKKELNDGNSSDISRDLAVKIGEALDNKKQAIILLNRRGHNTYVSCQGCGWVASCENCSISLTYHSANRRLMCHYCGASHEVPKKCPECDGEFFHFSGSGTQKLEEELSLLFPTARILRLDADTTGARDSYSNYLTAFANGEYDILLGTQMVAKGLDFPRVTVVGVIGADRALYSDDYRGYERTFSLLTQVVGRAGRADNPGVAVIQTNDTENNIISLAQRQDYDAFFKEEINNRKLMIFPPYCDICMVYVQSFDASIANDSINEIFANIKQAVASDYSDIKLIILGPAPATVPKVNNKYRYRIIIKTKNSSRFRDMIRTATDIKLKKDTYIGVDINPENII